MLGWKDFCVRARVDDAELTVWIEEGWIIPHQGEPEPAFNDIDLARVRLIRDLRHAMGVNDEGIGVVLGLVDQVHGLREALRQVLDRGTGRADG